MTVYYEFVLYSLILKSFKFCLVVLYNKELIYPKVHIYLLTLSKNTLVIIYFTLALTVLETID